MIYPDQDEYDLGPFLESFGVEAIYTAPGGARKSVRVIFDSFARALTETGAEISLPSPQATGDAQDFSDVREAGSTPTLEISGTVFSIVDTLETGTRDITLMLSEVGK